MQEEVASASNAINELGGEIGGIESIEYPGLQGLRTVVWVAKTRTTPDKYPRKSGRPNKHPL